MAASHVHAPDPKDVGSALRALRELTVQQGPTIRAIHQANRNGPAEFGDDTDSAPSIIPPEPAINQNEEIGVENPPTVRQSFRRRVYGTIVGGVVIAAAAGLAWQTYSNDQTKVMVKALWPSVHGVKLNPGSDLATNNTPQLTDQTAAVAKSPPTPAVAEIPPELLQQLQTIVSDLAVLRHAVEEIASNQGQTSRDIASIQAAQQNVSQRISSLARATSTLAAMQKSTAKLPHPQATNQSTASVPGPVPPAARAPLPMPSSSQSPTN
jgi:hypothetical protein